MLTVAVLGLSFCGILAAQERTEAAPGKVDSSAKKICPICGQEEQEKQGKENDKISSQQEELESVQESTKPWILRGIQGKLLMYIPNRFVDLFDIFSVSLDMGIAAGVTARLTYAFGLVGKAGSAASLIKGYNRQYGAALTEGYYGQFFFPMKADLLRPVTYGYVNMFWIEGWNYPFPSNPVFERKTGAFDYWAIEFGAICLVGAKVAIHPVEIADFITGLFLIDISGDDYGTRALK